MKLELIAALLHHPKVLFLDEPTIGLDVISQKKVREFLKGYNAEHGTTILLTSHYMQDIAELCERVILIDHGHLFFDGPLDAVLDRFATTKLLDVEFSAPCEADFSGLGRTVERDPARIRLEVPRDRVADACRHLLAAGAVADLSVNEIPIEEIIREVFGRARAKD